MSAAEESILKDLAKRARAGARQLSALESAERSALLRRLAAALLRESSRILAANEEDLAEGRRLVDEGRLAAALFKRLLLDLPKFMASALHQCLLWGRSL